MTTTPNRNYGLIGFGPNGWMSEDLATFNANLGKIDGDVHALFLALAGKRDADASIGMDKVTGLTDALTGKAAAGHSHQLADLSDVDAAQVGEGYLLARQAGAWVPVSVNAVFGQFSVNINSVDGLAEALNGKAAADHSHDGRYVRADQANVIGNPLTFADNVDLRLGSDGDLRFTFNGTNSYLQSFSNDLYIVNRAHGRETFIQGEKEDGTVRTAITIRDGHYPELLYDGVLKMAAYSGGVRAYGAMQVHEGGADRNVFHAGNVHANLDLTNGLFGGEVPAAYALKTEIPEAPTGPIYDVLADFDCNGETLIDWTVDATKYAYYEILVRDCQGHTWNIQGSTNGGVSYNANATYSVSASVTPERNVFGLIRVAVPTPGLSVAQGPSMINWRINGYRHVSRDGTLQLNDWGAPSHLRLLITGGGGANLGNFGTTGHITLYGVRTS